VKLQTQYPTPEQLQALYALVALERIGDDDAKKLLGELAKGAAESMLTKQANEAIERLGKSSTTAPQDAKLEALWADLEGNDSARALRAVRTLAARAKDAAPFLAKQLQPLADFDEDPARVSRLITDLDSEDFAVRDRASKDLERMGKSAEAGMRKALEASPSLEVKERINGLLEKLAKQAVSPEKLRAQRAFEALEWANSEEARQALERLGKEAKNRWIKAAVADSLQRMGSK
jgi:hypothetical protein